MEDDFLDPAITNILIKREIHADFFFFYLMARINI